MKLVLVSLIVFLMNIPFGYWRANVKKFSLQWVFSIHLPVPFIILMRIYGDIGFAWYTYVFLVAAFFLGQKLGGMLLANAKTQLHEVSSCLLMDLLHECRKSH